MRKFIIRSNLRLLFLFADKINISTWPFIKWIGKSLFVNLRTVLRSAYILRKYLQMYLWKVYYIIPPLAPLLAIEALFCIKFYCSVFVQNTKYITCGRPRSCTTHSQFICESGRSNGWDKIAKDWNMKKNMIKKDEGRGLGCWVMEKVLKWSINLPEYVQMCGYLTSIELLLKLYLLIITY